MMRICDYKDEYGLEIKKDVPYVDSRYVAEIFRKQHKNVLQDIRNLLSVEHGLSKEFSRLNFQPSNYTNECNMINKIVLGVSTQQFKKDNDIHDKSIRPYLSEEQLKQIDELQLMDSGLLLGCTDYGTRKMILENYYLKKYKGGE